MAGVCLRTGRGPRAEVFASGAGLLKNPHRLMQSPESGIEVGTGLFQRRMAEHVLHVMHRPARLQEPGTAFVAQVVEVKIDGSIGSL